MRKIVSVLGIVFASVLMAIIVTGCIPSAPEKPEKVGEKKVEEKVEKELEEEKPKVEVFNVGDEVKLGDRVLIVHGSSDYREPNEFMQPKEGNKYFAVEVTVENNGSESVSYNMFNFTLQDSKGYTYQVGMGGKEPNFSSGDLQAGRKVRGFVTFEVPKDASGFELIYQPSFWTASQVIVKL